MKKDFLRTEEIKRIIEKLKDSVLKIPSKKIPNDSSCFDSASRESDSAVFIITYGRPNDQITMKYLLGCKKFSQDYYLICSDDDESLETYLENYGDRVIVFNKDKVREYIDTGDNFSEMRVSLYQRNACFAAASILGYKYFYTLDDDYTEFSIRITDNVTGKLKRLKVTNADKMLNMYLNLLKTTDFRVVSMSSVGDYIGGENAHVLRGFKRKMTNFFVFDMSKPILFEGSFIEDIIGTCNLGRVGVPIISMFGHMMSMKPAGTAKGGMTDAYTTNGEYIKSFYALMWNPSSVKFRTTGQGDSQRIQHQISSRHSNVEIIDEKYSKNTYQELNSNDW